MLINAGPILSAISGYRLVWIAGRVGGHKTSLAYMIAKGYLEQGYRLITNNKSVWSDPLQGIELNENGQLKAVVVFDEGGLYFNTAKQVQQIGAYLAKMDVIMILPSFWAPSSSAQVITIQPLWNLKATGIPLVVYKWQVKIQSFKDTGYFLWWYPNEIYGTYSRQDPGADPAYITEYLQEKTEEFREYHGHKDKLPEVETSQADLLLEASMAIQEASAGLEALSARKHKRR